MRAPANRTDARRPQRQRSAVGTVIPTIGAVIPTAVGVDIGCGMIAARTIYSGPDLEGHNFADLRQAIENVIPFSPRNYHAGVDRCPFTPARLAVLEGKARTPR